MAISQYARGDHEAPTSSRPRVVPNNSEQIFQPKRNDTHIRSGAVAGEGFHRLKDRLISRGLPESVFDELFAQPTIVNYARGSFIFLQGGPTDLLFWVSSGLVDILSPGADGEQFHVSVLGPGDLFGFVESTDQKGRPAQAFQARARTNVQIGPDERATSIARSKQLRASAVSAPRPSP